MWSSPYVRDIMDIAWGGPFENLVLPGEVKDLLLAFARIKTAGDAMFDDFVGGKGKGISMLLSGPPGVGKTLTAEAIAEKLKVPVCGLSAGELGIQPHNVETELQSAMDKCVRWNEILLFDECDIFLEKRELNSLKRNELVSIFLRMVEYYEGIMLLTTNRLQAIDLAFGSRIDVAIMYEKLDEGLRRKAWENFLAKLSGEGVEIREGLLVEGGEEVKRLSMREMNRRQIKSAVKTARLLARSKEEPLGVEHLGAVMKLHRQWL
ncbi:MAG: hypothetical protein MMC23_000841 [Stictis urceolatum]|nr:hypothetical protein [Stictis urceolata]